VGLLGSPASVDTDARLSSYSAGSAPVKRSGGWFGWARRMARVFSEAVT